MKLPFFKIEAETKDSFESRTSYHYIFSKEDEKKPSEPLAAETETHYLRIDAISSVQPFRRRFYESEPQIYQTRIAMWDGTDLLCEATPEKVFVDLSDQAKDWEPESTSLRPTPEAISKKRLEKKAQLEAEEQSRREEEQLKEEERNEELRLERSLEEQDLEY